jgi:hypothetical protein
MSQRIARTKVSSVGDGLLLRGTKNAPMETATQQDNPSRFQLAQRFHNVPQMLNPTRFDPLDTDIQVTSRKLDRNFVRHYLSVARPAQGVKSGLSRFL